MVTFLGYRTILSLSEAFLYACEDSLGEARGVNGGRYFRLPPRFEEELFDFQKGAVKIAARHKGYSGLESSTLYFRLWVGWVPAAAGTTAFFGS